MGGPGREILAFAAAHGLIVAEQVQVLLGEGGDRAPAMLDALERCGLLRRVRLVPGGDGCYVITGAGLAAVGSDLPVPSTGLDGYRRTVGAGWVWVRAHDGRFGVVRSLTQREMVAHDLNVSASGRTRPYGIRIGGAVASNASGLHHPDLLLLMHDGWAAIHVQLGLVGRGRLAAALTSYGTDERFGLVVFMVEDDRVAHQVESAAAAIGLSQLTSVQWMDF